MSIPKRSFRPIAVLLRQLEMLTYRYTRLSRRLRVLHANENPRFGRNTILALMIASTE